MCKKSFAFLYQEHPIGWNFSWHEFEMELQTRIKSTYVFTSLFYHMLSSLRSKT